MSSSSETNGRRAECRSGTQTVKTDNQTGRSYALIPLVGITPNSIVYSNANACIYTFHEAVDYQPLRLPSYSYSYYLFTIILTDYSNNFLVVQLATTQHKSIITHVDLIMYGNPLKTSRSIMDILRGFQNHESNPNLSYQKPSKRRETCSHSLKAIFVP